MKKSISFFLLNLGFLSFAQVGINTETPQKTLHVNGTLQITNELNVGGNSSTAGSAGTSGQVLTSNGSNQAPTWKTISSSGSNTINSELVGFATKTTSQNSGSPILYNNTDNLISQYVSYSSNGNFTINTSGYYRIGFYVYTLLADGGGTITSSVRNTTQNSSIFVRNESTSSGLVDTGITMGGIVYLNQGDVLRTNLAYTRNITIRTASLSFEYLGSSL